MKSKIFAVLSALLFLGSLFCITSCNDLLTSQSSTKTNVKINLDVSKLIKNTRSAAVQQTKEYILKVFVYNAENYQPDTQIKNLPLIAEAKSKVNTNGIVSVSLQVPIDYSVFFVANLYELLDENTESTIPLYTGKSEIIKIKPEDNKVDLILSKSQADVDIDIDINTQSTYKVEHYQQNIEDDKYSLVEADTETKIGTIGTETEATAKSYDGFSVNPFEQKTILSDSSTTVKIYYTRNVYTVTFNANGGILNETNSQIVKYNGKSTEPTKPTKEGYNFAYWYTSKDNGVTEDISYNFLTPVTNNVTLYAMWIAGTDIVYKVEHYQQNIEDDEYSLVEADTETKKGTIGTQTEATAKSYEGFSVNPFEQKTILSNGSTTVKIYYTRNVYTVTFNANGGILSENSSQIVKYNGKSTEPTEPTKSEYFFDGWYTSSIDGTTLESKFDFSAPITSDITLYAKWIEQTEISYTVEHYQQNIDDDNYSLVSSEIKTRKTGEQIQAIPNEYYGFSVKTISQETLIEDGSSLVKIYYDRNLYTVTFNANGGNLLTDSIQYVKYEGTAEQPTLEGTSLYGWYKTNNITEMINSIPFDFSTPITQDTNLFAKWDFIYVKGAVINGTIKASGYTESEIFKEGAIVSIPNFYMCDHEVTQAEYKAIMGTWPDESMANEEMKGVGDNVPAYYVSWFDALVYCNERSIQEGLTPCYTINESTNPEAWGDVPASETHPNFTTWFNATCDFQANGYRLPTSAEWEYAARGGNELKGFQYQYAGSNSIDMVAWYLGNSDSTTYEVKTKQPNELGLYDMSGNVWEWSWNFYFNTNTNTYYRFTHGSAWDRNDESNFLSYHGRSPASLRGNAIGFRLVRTATEQSQGDVYSQGISLNGTTYAKTGEVVIIPAGTVAQIAMTDNGSWSSYCKDEDTRNQGVFLKDRKVQLSPFAMSQFEVTQELWFAIFGVNPSNFQTDVADGEIQNLRPVECITWYDAVNFCNELTKRTMGEEHCVYIIENSSSPNGYVEYADVSIDLSKKGYRLPTETEWEFAARGGNPTSEVWKYAYAGVQTSKTPENFTEEPYNDNNLENYAWYNNNSNNKTHEVGKKLPNTLGIYDMNGNVDELCYDWYDIVYTENDFIINPEGPSSGENRIKRGGGYNSIGSYGSCVSGRYDILPNDRPYPYSCGFRIVRTITE